MEFSNAEKLIVAMLSEIHKALKIKDGLNPDLIQSAVASGHTWALHWQYPGLFQDENETPNEVRVVAEILDMWERIERSFSDYSQVAKDELARLSPVYGTNVRFPGFDGNGESGYSITSVLVNELGRWSSFHGRDLNSHCPMYEPYVRMLRSLEDLHKGPMDYALSPPEMAALLNSMVHPENR